MATERRRTHFIIALIAPVIDGVKRTFVQFATGGGGGGAVTGSSGAGSAHTHAFTGTAPQAAEVDAATGTGYATVGQDVTTVENFTVGLNQYAGHWLLVQGEAPCLIASHPAVTGAPLVLTVFGLAPPTSGSAFKILRAPTPAGTNMNESAHTHGAGTFEAPSGGGVTLVHHDADERTVSTADATDLTTSLALCKALLTVYAAHRVDTTHHKQADTVNTVASAVADVVDLPSAITAANQLRTAFGAHRSQANVHWTNDSGHAVSAPAASDQSSLNTLLTELKADINGHFADDALDDFASWRLVG